MMPQREFSLHAALLGWLLCFGIGGCDRGSQSGGGAASSQSSPEAPPSLETAQDALASGDIKTVEAVARQILLREPEHLEARVLLVAAAVQRSDTEAAVSLLTALSESHPKLEPQFATQAAELLFREGQDVRAIELLNTATERHPDELDLRRNLAGLLNSRGFRFDANEQLRFLAGRTMLSPRELIALINPLLTWETFSEKPSIDDEALVSQKGLLNVVAALRGAGDVREALALLESSELLDAQNPAALAMHGWMLSINQEFERLDEWARGVPSTCQRYPAYWLAMGNRLLHLKAPSSATCFVEALAREPGATEALTGLSQALALGDKQELAPKVLERQKAISALQSMAYQVGSGNASDPELATSIGRLMNQIGRPIESLAWQETLIAMFSPSAAELEILQNHKTKVLEQMPSGRNEDLVICEIDPNQLAPFDPNLKLAAQGSESTATMSMDSVPIIESSIPVFKNVAGKLGINMRHRNAIRPIEKDFRLFEALGSGVACFDFDRDGRVDLYLGQAGSDPPNGVSEHGNQLWRNTQPRFVDVSNQASCEDFGYTHGVTAGDWNQDGFTDLLIANVGVNRMMLNQGDGTFREATPEQGDLPPTWSRPMVSTSLAMGDVTGDALPDLVEVNYVDDPTVYRPIEYGADGNPVVLPGPKHFRPAEPRLFVNAGNGTARGESFGASAEIASTGLGVLITDLDGDRRNEVFIANDQNPNQLWRFQPDEADGSWIEYATTSGCAFGTGGKPFACMGIAAADFDGNGMIDLHITNFNGECSNLYLQESAGSFVDRAIAYELDLPTTTMVGFGTQAFDFDNNSSIDLAIGNGHIEDFRDKGKPFRMPTQILAARGNRFESIPVQGDATYWSKDHLARAVAKLDWNRDGRMDLAITDLTEAFVLLENQTQTDGGFFQIELIGVVSERDAIGTKVTFEFGDRIFTQTVQSGDGYLCKNEAALHVGLGNAERVDRITVHWPSGIRQEITDVGGNQRCLLIEGETESWPR